MTAFRHVLMLASVLGFAALAQAQTAIAPAGSGTARDPYRVASLENLYWISKNPGSWRGTFEQIADIDARATATWDGGKGFQPIGARFDAFEGTYLGHGHSIRGLTTNRPDSGKQGLFGWVGFSGNLDSIVLLEASIVGYQLSGALAGVLEGGRVFGCRATGTVRTAQYTAGGLVGYSNGGRIERSQADVSVSDGFSGAGGLVGENNGQILDCSASGGVDGKHSVGGLVGYNQGLIFSSAATGDVTGDASIGGLAGLNRGPIRYSHAAGKVKAFIPPGGMFGHAAGGLVGENEAEISYCHATGAVEAEYHAGGLAGSSTGPIDHSFATGDVVAHVWNAGGLVGVIYGDRFLSSPPGREYFHGAIRQSYATGSVHASRYAGGLVGSNAISAVVQAYATGAVSGDSAVGGLFGSLFEDSTFADPTVVESRWDVERSGQQRGCGTCLVRTFHAQGHDSSAMRARATYAGWDFSQVWSIDEALGAPLLHIRSKPQTIVFPKLPIALLADSFVTAGAWASSDLRVVLTSSDPSIVTTDGSRIRFLAAGSVTITARQDGDTNYLPAAPVSQVFHVTSSAPAGRGTSADPYRIANLEDLRRLSLDTAVWAAHFVQIADIDASPTATWDSGRGFQPIGRTRFKYFTGFYNGRGHAISALTIHRDTSSELGLFGFFLYANRIDSIRLVDVSIRGRSSCGGLVGGMMDGRINAVDVSGLVSCQEMAGGLVGWNSFSGEIVSSSSSASVRGGRYIGGLLGSNTANVRRSWATGPVSGRRNVGGLVGTNRDSIENCYARGSVIGDTAVGGLVGEALEESFVASSYATGRVEGDTAVGGLVGSSLGASVLLSYWDSEATGRTLGLGSSRPGDSAFVAFGRTTSQMRASDTYVGWDFSTIWSIEEGVDYPVLRGAADIPSSGRGSMRRSRNLTRGSYPVEVYDLRGRLVWQGDALWNGTRWELPRLGAGAWVLRARTEREVVVQRLATFR